MSTLLDLVPTSPKPKKEIGFFLITVRFQEASVDTPQPGLSFYINTNGPSFKPATSPSVVSQNPKAGKP